jgi:uncharacterized damage-inducible protein DinB
MLYQTWSSAWEGAGWGPAWKGAFEGLSAAQAAWKPGALDGEELPTVRRDRVHSIWQILNHVVFWREAMVRMLEPNGRPSEDEIARRNWEEPAPGGFSEAAWADAKARYVASHELMANAIAKSDENAKKLAEMLPHDAYHIGQVYTMRALLGV